jgi:hypothetical protein
VNDLWDAHKNDYVRHEHKSLDGTEQRWNRSLNRSLATCAQPR